jgi:type VI secretion system protein ImpI/type VI secretion system protein
LPDRAQFLSRLHCEFAPLNGAWWVIDHSRHGTFLNRQTEPIDASRHELRDGDHIRLGDYTFEVRAGTPAQDDNPWNQPPPNFWDQAAAPLAATPAPIPAPPILAPPILAPPILPPNDLAPPWNNIPPAAGAAPTGKLPDDWWLEKDADPASAPVPPPLPPPIAPLDPAAITPHAAAPPPLPPQPAWAAEPPTSDALLAAFLRGAGIPGFKPEDAIRSMEQAGAALRALVAGLQQVRVSRAALKREFRIAESTFQPKQFDNPLRDLLNEEEALRGLLSGRFAAGDAVTDVLKRVRLHELALVAAMRDAAEGLIEALSPAQVAASTRLPEPSALLPDRRKARAWEAYEALHRKIADAMADDFDSAFGKTFARAYEKVVQHASPDGADPPPAPRPKRNGSPR